MLAELAVVVKTRVSEQRALATFGWPALVMSAFQSHCGRYTLDSSHSVIANTGPANWTREQGRRLTFPAIPVCRSSINHRPRGEGGFGGAAPEWRSAA